jgi:hypothetical protein
MDLKKVMWDIAFRSSAMMNIDKQDRYQPTPVARLTVGTGSGVERMRVVSIPLRSDGSQWLYENHN